MIVRTHRYVLECTSPVPRRLTAEEMLAATEGARTSVGAADTTAPAWWIWSGQGTVRFGSRLLDVVAQWGHAGLYAELWGSLARDVVVGPEGGERVTVHVRPHRRADPDGVAEIRADDPVLARARELALAHARREVERAYGGAPPREALREAVSFALGAPSGEDPMETASERWPDIRLAVLAVLRFRRWQDGGGGRCGLAELQPWVEELHPRRPNLMRTSSYAAPTRAGG